MTSQCLQQLLAAREARFASPFLMLGDPTPELSVALAKAAFGAGARMLEVGFPYSDPCADGPAIQASCARAFAGGTSTDGALKILARIANECPGMALNLLVYGNLVHARGYDAFCGAVADAGASSLLVPDIPWDEGASLLAACKTHSLDTVQLAAPVTTPERLQQLDAATTGFLYLAGLQGVTGSDATAEANRTESVARVVNAVRAPVCLGFGLSAPSHLTEAFAGGAQIAVVGSHLARAIGSAFETNPDSTVDAFVDSLSPLLVQQACRHTAYQSTKRDSKC